MKVRALVDYIDGPNPIPPWLQWRITNPFDRLNKVWRGDSEENSFEFMSFDIDSELEKDIDILILPRIVIARQYHERALEWFQKIKNQGTKFIYEADDDIFSEHYVSQLSKLTWKHNYQSRPEVLIPVLHTFELQAENAIWTMRQCDAVIVANKALGLYVQTLIVEGQKLYVVPNAIDRDKFEVGLNERIPSNFIYIGWAGGTRNDTDLQEMLEAWIKIRENYDQVRFIVGGYCPELIKTNKLLASNTVNIGWKASHKYASTMQVDIGCVSIANNHFGQRKSPIKAWEYALAGASVIGSKTVYSEEPVLLVAEDVDDWYAFLEYTIQEKDFRTDYASAYRQHVVQHHLLNEQIYYWEETYKNVSEKLEM